jgi:cytochrome c553
MIRFFAATSLALICATTSFAAGDPAKGQVIASQVCVACHGIDGNSPLPMNPNLAGQHPEYVAKQLMNYSSGSRMNPIMAGMVANLSPEDMKNLSAYYGAQRPRAMAAQNKERVAQGRKLYRAGNAQTGLAACSGCHLPNGAGIPAQFPRLAGQNPEYIVTQLKAFRAGERANDPNNMMRAVASKLADKDMAAIAEYLAGLQ